MAPNGGSFRASILMQYVSITSNSRLRIFFPALVGLLLLLPPVSHAQEGIRNVQEIIASSMVLIQSNKLDQAEKSLKKAVQLGRENLKARYLLGTIYEKKGEYSKVVRSYRYAIALDSKYLEAYKAWARVEIEQRDEKDAIGPLGEIISLESDNVEAYYQLGRLHNKYGSRDNNKARRYLEKALKLEPNHQPSLEELVTYYNNIGYKSKARRYEDQLAALDGGRNSAAARGASTRSFTHSRGVRSTSKRHYASSRKYGRNPYGGAKKSNKNLFEGKSSGTRVSVGQMAEIGSIFSNSRGLRALSAAAVRTSMRDSRWL